MKRIMLLFALLAAAACAFAERVTFTTGDLAGVSRTDRFFPTDPTMLAAPCNVTAVYRVENGLWCLKLTAGKTNGDATYPVEFSYYVKVGDTIRLGRLNANGGGLTECALTVASIDWNTVTFDIR